MRTLLHRAACLAAFVLAMALANDTALADNHQVKQYAQSVVNIYVFAENDKGPVLVSGSGSIVTSGGMSTASVKSIGSFPATFVVT